MWLTLSYRHGNANGFNVMTIASLLKQCSKDKYPDLSVLLKLAATLPKTCEFERSFTVLQTWLSTSMITKRLSSLAIIKIHRGVQIDYKRAKKIFLELHPWKLNVSNLIFERSKYVVSLHLLEKAISVLQPFMGPFFQVYRHSLNVFLRAWICICFIYILVKTINQCISWNFYMMFQTWFFLEVHSRFLDLMLSSFYPHKWLNCGRTLEFSFDVNTVL